MKRANIHQVVKTVLLDALRVCSFRIAGPSGTTDCSHVSVSTQGKVFAKGSPTGWRYNRIFSGESLMPVDTATTMDENTSHFQGNVGDRYEIAAIIKSIIKSNDIAFCSIATATASKP